RGDAGERPRLEAGVERDAELDRLGARAADLGERLERDLEAAADQPELRQDAAHLLGQPRGRGGAAGGQLAGEAFQLGTRLRFLFFESATVERAPVQRVQLLAGAEARGDHVRQRGTVLGPEPEEEVLPAADLVEAGG